MSTALAPVDLVKTRMDTMLQVMPERSRERFRAAAIGVASQPTISRCTPDSVFKCIYSSARLNLICDPVLQHAAVVPFKNKGKSEATLIIMYRGMIELAKRACPGLRITAGTVYESDTYTLEQGTEEKLVIHKRWWEKGDSDPGKVAFFYATAKEPGGEALLAIVPKAEALQIGESSRAGMKPGTPWHDHFERMGEKTAVKRLMRFVSIDPDKPESRQLSEALTIDDHVDDVPDVPYSIEVVDDIEEPPTGRSRPAKPAPPPPSRPEPEVVTLTHEEQEESDNEDAGDALFGASDNAPDDGPATLGDKKDLAAAVDAKLEKLGMDITRASREAVLFRALGDDFKAKLGTALRSDVRTWRGAIKRLRQSGIETAMRAVGGL